MKNLIKKILLAILFLLLAPVGQGVIFLYLGEGFANGFIEGLVIDFVFILAIVGFIFVILIID
jgi:hypothetical protein